MDLRAIGTGAPNTDPSVRAAGIPPPPPGASHSSSSANPTPDTIATLLEQLATSGVADLIVNLDARRSSVDAAVVNELFRAAGQAAAAGDVSRVLARAGDLLRLNPELAERVRAEPSLAPVRGQVNNFLRDEAVAARASATDQIEAASVAADSVRLSPRERRDADLVLSLANRLCDEGRHIDFVRAGELAQALLLEFPGVLPMPARKPADGLRARRPVPFGSAGNLAIARAAGQLRRSLAGWWRRAPVLVLLMAWLTAGVLAIVLRQLWPDSWRFPVAAEVWAVGILVFVVYIRIRSLRF